MFPFIARELENTAKNTATSMGACHAMLRCLLMSLCNKSMISQTTKCVKMWI